MILKNWTDKHSEKFRNEAFKVKHDLTETGLFTDEALADLLDRHPKDQLDVCTLKDHDVFGNTFRTGDVRGVDGRTLIDAVKKGSIWMNLRKAMNLHPDYKAVLDKMFAELSEISGQKPFQARGGILISSPTAKAPFHFDPTETILWHIRGHKKFFLYPDSEDFLADKDYEKVIFSQSEDNLPYRTDMESSAQCFDLFDNEMLTWPLNRPHRVENMSYCVSVSTEYSTAESSIKNAAMYTNAALRNKFGMSPNWRTASLPEKVVKAGMGRVLRKIGVLNEMRAVDYVSFQIDPNLPNYIRDVPPYERNF